MPERFRILHLLLESVVYDGATGELHHHARTTNSTREAGGPACCFWGNLMRCLVVMEVALEDGIRSVIEGARDAEMNTRTATAFRAPLLDWW